MNRWGILAALVLAGCTPAVAGGFYSGGFNGTGAAVPVAGNGGDLMPEGTFLVISGEATTTTGGNLLKTGGGPFNGGGDLAWHLYSDNWDGTESDVWQVSSSGEGMGNNFGYRPRILAAGGFSSFHESGSGTDHTGEFDASVTTGFTGVLSMYYAHSGGSVTITAYKDGVQLLTTGSPTNCTQNADSYVCTSADGGASNFGQQADLSDFDAGAQFIMTDTVPVDTDADAVAVSAAMPFNIKE